MIGSSLETWCLAGTREMKQNPIYELLNRMIVSGLAQQNEDGTTSLWRALRSIEPQAKSQPKPNPNFRFSIVQLADPRFTLRSHDATVT